MRQPGDSTILERFKKGDQLAVGMVIDRFRPYVRAIIRAARSDQPLAAADESDLIQDLFLQAFRKASTFRGNTIGELVRWLRMVTIRMSRKSLSPIHEGKPRVLTADLEDELVEDEIREPERMLQRQETSALMAAALNRLPKEMQQVLLLRIVDGRSHRDIAIQMNRSPGSVRMLFLRSIEELREVWGKGDSCLCE